MKTPAFLRTLARNGHLGQAVGAVVSAGLLALIVSGGFYILPGPEAAAEVRFYKSPVEPADAIPVFAMRPDRSVVRNALAEADADGVLRIAFFNSKVAHIPGATEPLLFDAALTVLWMTATDESQAELRRRLGGLQDQVGRSFEEVITSPVFTAEYRPRLRALLTDAITVAWKDAQTQAALRQVTERAAPMVAQSMRSEIGDALRPRFQQALWDMAAANWTNVFGAMVGYDLDYMPLNDAVAATMRDPQVQAGLTKLGTAVLETAEARRLCERVLIATAGALTRDPRLPGLAAEMFHDVRLHDQMRPLSAVFMDVVRALPRHLGGLGSESNLNPLAAQVFKAVALNRSGKVILFVPPADRDRILRQDPEAAVPLETLGRPLQPMGGAS